MSVIGILNTSQHSSLLIHHQVCRDILSVLSNSKLWLEDAVLDSKDLVLGEDQERKQRKMEEKLNK